MMFIISCETNINLNSTFLPCSSKFKNNPSKKTASIGSCMTPIHYYCLLSLYRDIEPGEIIAVDRPVVKHLDKEYTKTHCWNCLRSTQKYATVPCSMCSGVLFCSELCRKIAQETYHKYDNFS